MLSPFLVWFNFYRLISLKIETKQNNCCNANRLFTNQEQ